MLVRCPHALLAGEGRGELVAYSRELLLHVGGELVVVLLDAVQDIRLKKTRKKKGTGEGDKTPQRNEIENVFGA